MKYLRLASVAALVSAATVSAGPLGAREYDGYCPKGYTMSVYYKTVTVETYPTATSVETTVTPTSTPVTVESQPSAEPTATSSSTAIVVESTTPVAVVQVETTTSSASAAETSTAKSSAAEAAVVKTAPVVDVLPTASVETAAVVKTLAAPAVETAAAQSSTTQAPIEVASTSTTQAPVEVASTSTTQAPVEAASTSTESATSSATKSASNKAVSTGSSNGTPGKATFYGGNVAGGTCSFSGYTIPSHLFGTALSLQRWDNAAECGACVSVTGPKGNSIKAMIVDQCPECESNHLDLFQNAFAELSDISAGIIQTTWSYVSCDLDGPLKLKNKEGTSAYWFSMQVVNANEVVTALEVSTDGGSSWKSTTRTNYNFFENTAGFGASTVDVRVTGASGKTVVVKDVGVSSGTEVTAGSNL
ncbi:hypothetical protein N7537_005921 [Penicillium hordei]|uniref:Expansin-like EG45 domain-containing protein n=1 Tax=Penicillium hordei TaxID=40994 RepID=A0AAD6H3Y3_9EURO|nr:uncharacterized protein N7537_005921 [Penicillium hordei]KAJ5602965.1 hypothetical protein N7537_005921 [Penicillium hordei]